MKSKENYLEMGIIYYIASIYLCETCTCLIPSLSIKLRGNPKVTLKHSDNLPLESLHVFWENSYMLALYLNKYHSIS